MTLDMNRQSLTADLNHFGVNYTDSSGNVWVGTALWRWVSWSNYNGGVTNATLDKGYTVKVISGDGSSTTFDDSQVKMNDNIIVAAKLNGAVLSDPYWPLTMVGSDVSSSKMIKNIVQIQIIIDQPTASRSYTNTSPTTTAIANIDSYANTYAHTNTCKLEFNNQRNNRSDYDQSTVRRSS